MNRALPLTVKVDPTAAVTLAAEILALLTTLAPLDRITSSLIVGTAPPLQFDAVDQLPPLAPIHVVVLSKRRFSRNSVT
jgi:hypothetical protein